MARLTATKRNDLSAKTFVFPGTRKYPIPDKSHGRAALQRASQFGTPEVKAKVRAAVHRKFPGIKQHDESRMRMDGGAVKHRMDRAPRKH